MSKRENVGTGEVLAFSDEDSWLTERAKMLTASDVPAMLGLSPWMSPFSLAMAKLGLRDRVVETFAMRTGKVLEPVVADQYHLQTGYPLEDLGRHTIIRCAAHPWLGASLDRLVTFPDGSLGVVEIKTTTDYEATGEGSVKRRMYEVQLQTQLLCAGLTRGVLVVAIGNRELWVNEYAPHAKLQSVILERGKAFMDGLGTGELPSPTHQDASFVREMFPDDDSGATLNLGEEHAVWADAIADANERMRAAKAAADEAKAKLAWAMGSSPLAMLPDGREIKFKSVTRKGYTVAESAHKEMRIVNVKEKGGTKWE